MFSIRRNPSLEVWTGKYQDPLANDGVSSVHARQKSTTTLKSFFFTLLFLQLLVSYPSPTISKVFPFGRVTYGSQRFPWQLIYAKLFMAFQVQQVNILHQ